MGTPAIENNHVEKHHPADCESCFAEPPEPLTNITNTQHASLFFNDGERSIDYVLVWKLVDDVIQEDLNCTKRAIFEDNLVNEGLQLERETIDQFHFTKIHTPIEVLRRYAEILKLRMPMKEVILPELKRHPLHILSYRCTNFSLIFFVYRPLSTFSHYVLLNSKIIFHDFRTPHSLSPVRSAENLKIDRFVVLVQFVNPSICFPCLYICSNVYLFYLIPDNPKLLWSLAYAVCCYFGI